MVLYRRRRRFLRRRPYRRRILRRRRPTKSLYRRRNYKRRRFNAPLSTKSPTSAVFYTKFKFSTTFSLTLDALAITIRKTFGINDPYHPDYLSSSYHCSGFHELMSVYKHCVCFAAKISAESVITENDDPETCFFIMDDSSAHDYLAATSINWHIITERNLHTVYRYIYSRAYQTSHPYRLSLYRKTKILDRQPDLDRGQYSCTASSSPSNICLSYVGLTLPEGGSTSVHCRFFVKITYYCRLTDFVDTMFQ